jgi:hypothetical protein
MLVGFPAFAATLCFATPNHPATFGHPDNNCYPITIKRHSIMSTIDTTTIDTTPAVVTIPPQQVAE